MSVSVVLCDFDCHPRKKIDLQSLKDDLSKAGIDAAIVAKPCRQDVKDLKSLKGKKVLFAGCPQLERIGFYGDLMEKLSLKPSDFASVDVKSTVFDLYENTKGLSKNLVTQLSAYSRMLESRESIDLETIEPGEKVLVFGSGYSGLKAALALAGNDVPVDLLDVASPAVSPGCFADFTFGRGITIGDAGSRHTKSAHAPSAHATGIELLRSEAQKSDSIVFIPHKEGYRLEALENGYHMKTADGMEALYGSIVFAPECVEEPCAEEGALNLTEIYSQITRQMKLDGATVFLLDRERSSSAEILRDVMKAATYIRNRFHGDVWVLLKNVQVSNQYQEEMYQECRDAGVIFVKYRDDLAVVNDFGSFEISGHDTQLSAAFTVSRPARLIIPQTLRLTPEAKELAANLRLRLVGDRYSQPDSLWTLPSETNRAGVYAVGAARSNMIPSSLEEDAYSLAGAIRLRTALPGIPVEENIPVVDANLCVYCLTCIRVCPFGAMTKDTEERIAAVVASACKACGICVAECPAQAIDARNLERETLFTGIKILADGRTQSGTGLKSGSQADGKPAVKGA